MKPVSRRHVVVTAAVIERGGAFLMTRRLEGTHLAGHWEFPGGKRYDDETLEASLIREIREELDARIEVGAEVLATTHEYPDWTLELRFFRCVLRSEPQPVIGQLMRWVPRVELASLPLPPGDDDLVRKLIAGEI
jgi:8-oxo-dGTP diphosphatase